MEYEEDDSQIFFDEVKNEMEYETVDAPTPFKRIRVWSNSETRQLMDLYKRLIHDVGPKKRFTIKKEMWAEISTYFPNKGPKQCEQRYNTVLKRKKKGLTKVYISEARRKTIDCAQNAFQINRLLKKDKRRDKIIPLNYTEKKIYSTKKSLTIPETLLQISAKREEAKERRHREKMQVIKQMQNLLQQILDSSKNK